MKRLLSMVLLLALGATGSISAKVIGRINGYPITERSANDFLRVVTKGKVKFHQLKVKDKKDVVKRVAVDSLLIGMAKKNLSKQEINQVIVNYWLSRKIKNITVDPEDAKKAYTSNKKFFKDPKGNILPFEKVKDIITVSLKQKKYVAKLMNSARITMGKRVIVSPKNSKKTSSNTKKKSSKYNGKTKTYTVKSGNTLSGIAHKYHITISQLRSMNGMSVNDSLRIGQKLKVPY